MAVTAAPSWGFGLSPVKINPLPASFVAFFPTDVPTRPRASTNGSKAPGDKPEEIYWTGHLANPPPVCRLPAWERVPIQAHSGKPSSGTIMKRVAVLNFEPSSPYSLQARAEARSPADTPKSARQKLLHRPWDGLKQHAGFSGAPLTEAVVTSLRMQARVDIANSILKQSNVRLPSASESRLAPAKRTLTIEGYCDGRVKTGNKLPLYIELRPLLEKAVADGLSHIDMAKASFAHSTAILQGLHHDPRVHLAAQGGSDLSFITDATEPSSPHVISPPRTHGETKSPTKRDTIPSSPLQNSCNRLKAAKVDLLPTASPKVEPSPTKSASSPSTPFKDLPTTKLVSTPPLPSPEPVPHSASEEQTPKPSSFYTPSNNATPSVFKLPGQLSHVSPTKTAVASPWGQVQTEVFTPQTDSKRPGRTFRAPSFLDSSGISLDAPTQDEHEPSPIGYSRPVAPTPSRWNRTDLPSTPRPETPSQNDALGLVAAIPAGTPEPEETSFDVDVSANISSFDFGPHSLIFATCTVEGNDQPDESQRVKDQHARRRRQSEPLFKTAFKAQQRRRSASPHKSIQETPKSSAEGAALPNPADTPKASIEKPFELADYIHMTPLTSDGSKVEGTPASVALGTPGPSMNTPSIKVPSVSEQTPLAATPDVDGATIDNPSVLNIDVRQNPDIFGIHRSDHGGDKLAQVGEAGCDDLTTATTSLEEGRLVAQFKLPTEHASMLPPSQGCEESEFNTSPLGISSSPRIRFEQPQASQTPSRDRKTNPFTSNEHRLAPSSPTKTAPFPYSSPTRPTRSSPLKLPPLIQSPIDPPSTGKRSALWERLSNRSDNDATLLVDDFGVAGIAQSSPYKSVAGTPVYAERSDLFTLDTPSLTGIGVVERETPEHLRFSMLQSPFAETPVTFTPSTRGAVILGDTPSQSQSTPTPGSNLQTPTCSGASDAPASAKSATSQSPKLKSDSPVVETQRTPEPQDSTPIVPSTSPKTQEGAASATTPPPRDEAEKTTPESSPTLNLSFTPVNSPPSSGSKSPEARLQLSPSHGRSSVSVKEEKEVKTPSPAAATSPVAEPSTVEDDDSPGREHMRKFIERNKSKRLSTLETGSPFAQPADRKPLEAKSPNAVSPQKVKRKLEEDEASSPPKKAAEPVAKRTRRTLRGTKSREDDDIDELAATDMDVLTAGVDGSDAQAGDDEADNAPVARRSRRLRLDRPASANSKLATARSAIPTLRYRSGAGGGTGGQVLNSAVRNEQQELMHQTRMNTRKNKGNAEYPEQVLAKRSKELQGEEEQEKTVEPVKAPAKARKTVVWREPLEAHQEKPKKGKPPVKTAKPSGVSKPRKAAATTKTETVEARPQRMTRSRTRSQA